MVACMARGITLTMSEVCSGSPNNAVRKPLRHWFHAYATGKADPLHEKAAAFLNTRLKLSVGVWVWGCGGEGSQSARATYHTIPGVCYARRGLTFAQRWFAHPHTHLNFSSAPLWPVAY